MSVNFSDVRRVVDERGELLGKINEAISSLNDNFASNPMRLDTEAINDLIKNLMRINEDLSAKEKDIEPKKDRWWKFISPTSIATTTMQTVSWVTLTAIGIWSISTRNKRDCTNVAQDVSTISISAFGLFLTTVLAFTIKSIDDDRDRYIFLSEIRKIDFNGEKRFYKFLELFEEFKKSQTEEKDLKTQERFLKKCIVSFGKLPKK